MRWLDRVVYEQNIIKARQGLVAIYYQYEPRPFTGIDPHTMMRDVRRQAIGYSAKQL